MFIVVPTSEVTFSYARSSGPGGQNVNKTESKVILHWSLDRAVWVPDDVKSRFREAFGSRVNSSGEVVIHSDESRDRLANEKSCMEKLTNMLRKVWIPPKKRIATKPTRSSQRKRIESKRMRSDAKKARRSPNDY
ncbi:MAG: alternative ribosome rescue aminoacyl-tRNA hydrolase ArfB [bacterium]